MLVYATIAAAILAGPVVPTCRTLTQVESRTPISQPAAPAAAAAVSGIISLPMFQENIAIVNGSIVRINPFAVNLSADNALFEHLRISQCGFGV